MINKLDTGILNGKMLALTMDCSIREFDNSLVVWNSVTVTAISLHV
jgi:hypothetical protein